jgi:hypothetical protein
MRRFLKRQKGLVQIYWRVGRKEFILISSALIAVGSITIEWNKWFTVSFFLAAVGIVCTFIDFRRVKRESAEYQVAQRPNVQQEWANLSLSTRYLGWKKYSGRHGTAWYDSRVNRIISEQSVPLRVETSDRTLSSFLGTPARFELSERIQKFERFILFDRARGNSLVYNEPKIRISTDLTVDRLRTGQPITIGRTTYFDSLCTNDFTPYVLQQQRNTSSVALSGIEIVSSGGILRDLSESNLSNHVGGSTLAFTSDDYLVIQRQTKLNRQSPGRLAPSGSGSLDWKDARRASTLADFAKTGLRRELVEETGLPKHVKFGLEILGVVRHTHRGGQVEFFGIARLPAGFEQLRTSKLERLFVFDRRDDMKCEVDDPSLLADRVRTIYDDLLNDKTTDVSFPLEMAFHLLVEALIERPGLVGRALGIDRWVQEDPESVS